MKSLDSERRARWPVVLLYYGHIFHTIASVTVTMMKDVCWRDRVHHQVKDQDNLHYYKDCRPSTVRVHDISQWKSKRIVDGRCWSVVSKTRNNVTHPESRICQDRTESGQGCRTRAEEHTIKRFLHCALVLVLFQTLLHGHLHTLSIDCLIHVPSMLLIVPLILQRCLKRYP